MSTLNSLLLLLASAQDALSKHNFNLAEVWMEQYFETLPKKLFDSRLAKNIYDALKERNFQLLSAGIDAEIERLEILKIELLRERVVR